MPWQELGWLFVQITSNPALSKGILSHFLRSMKAGIQEMRVPLLHAKMTVNGPISFIGVVMGLFFAEEENIPRDSSGGVLVVKLFGEGTKQMLRDSVLAVGRYGEIYNRTLASTMPRSGGNMLNKCLAGPQHYPMNLL